jgi:hypothetical protein
MTSVMPKFSYRPNLPAGVSLPDELFEKAERANRRLFERAWLEKDWDGFILVHQRGDRWRALKIISRQIGVTPELARLFREVWIDTEDVYRERRIVREMIGLIEKSGLLEHLFSPEDRRRFDSLPDTFTIYRGAKDWNRSGMSWTLDIKTAAGFATRSNENGCCYRLKPEDFGFVMEKTVTKSDVLFYSNERKEEEVILPSFQRGSICSSGAEILRYLE